MESPVQRSAKDDADKGDAACASGVDSQVSPEEGSESGTF